MTRKKDIHGSNSTYQNHRCRCVLCKYAHRQYMRDWRKRKAALAEDMTSAASPIGDHTERGNQDV